MMFSILVFLFFISGLNEGLRFSFLEWNAEKGTQLRRETVLLCAVFVEKELE